MKPVKQNKMYSFCAPQVLQYTKEERREGEMEWSKEWRVESTCTLKYLSS